METPGLTPKNHLETVAQRGVKSVLPLHVRRIALPVEFADLALVAVLQGAQPDGGVTSPARLRERGGPPRKRQA